MSLGDSPKVEQQQKFNYFNYRKWSINNQV